MKEYIERGALIEEFDCAGGQFVYGDYVPAIISRIKQVPTADVVEVVRCKECEFWNTYIPYPDGVGCCQTHNLEITGKNDFCSYGIRKDK